jgi:hypothetical protein
MAVVTDKAAEPETFRICASCGQRVPESTPRERIASSLRGNVPPRYYRFIYRLSCKPGFWLSSDDLALYVWGGGSRHTPEDQDELLKVFSSKAAFTDVLSEIGYQIEHWPEVGYRLVVIGEVYG